MELKVWVDGIQRIVCGVTENTSCQDVVYALAHATGQTGRFTLVERWRGNERTLSPQDRPLKVLSKWGEYSSDVQFILRRSALDPSNPVSPGIQNRKDQGFLRNFSPPLQKTACPLSPPLHTAGIRSPQGKEAIKKSLTFSGGHHSESPSFQQNMKDSLHFCEIPKGIVRGIPQQSNQMTWDENSKEDKNRSPSNKSNTNFKSDERSSVERKLDSPQSSDKSVKADSPFLTQEKQIPLSPQPSSSFPNATRLQGRESSPISKFPNTNFQDKKGQPVSSGNKQAYSTTNSTNISVNPPVTSSLSPSNLPPSYPNQGGPPPYPGQSLGKVNSPLSPPPYRSPPTDRLHKTPPPSEPSPSKQLPPSGEVDRSPKTQNTPNQGTPKSRRNLFSQFKTQDLNEMDFLDTSDGSHEESNGFIGRIKGYTTGDKQSIPDNRTDVVKVVYDSRYRDLVHLVNLQREKLSNQQAELTQYDAEIVYWEEKQKEHLRQAELIEAEIRRLELAGHDADAEATHLDQLRLEDELELGHQQERTIRSELTLLRSKLANCETELLQCKNKIRLLLDEISDERRQLTREEEDRKEREINLLNEIDELQKEIQDKIIEYESKMSTSERLSNDIAKIEVAIAKKKKEVDDLVHEMKEVNLESLALSPGDEVKSLIEGGIAVRPGSARKIIGSPRQLENAVPTSKNPHGVWV